MCSKIVKVSVRDFGVIGKLKCSKPDFKDGLCKHHYTRRNAKLINWMDRKGYRNATQHDLDTGRSMKLKHSHAHKLYQCRKGVIKIWSRADNKYIECGLPSDFNLFCVLDY
jgi:dissimilatory sulfite reductase (desulfoviridin) alpha/beta subunit